MDKLYNDIQKMVIELPTDPSMELSSWLNGYKAAQDRILKMVKERRYEIGTRPSSAEGSKANK